MPEATKDWQPIPERFNSSANLDLVLFKEVLIHKLTVIIACSYFIDYNDEDNVELGAWQIDFEGVRAFRMNDFNNMKSLTRRDKGKALWEITMSDYVETVRDNMWIRKADYHHYVIMSDLIVYEILAKSWSSSQLPPEWAFPWERPFPYPNEESTT